MRALILTIVLGSLLGCQALSTSERATIAELKIVGDICDTLSVITYDGKLDTQPTKEQIRTYNAKRAAFCNGTSTQKETK